MTTPAVSTIKRSGSRFYVNPETKEKVPGVTSVVGMLPKDFLKFWAAKLVAEQAVENIGSVVGMIANGDKVGAVDYLKRAPSRNTSGAADVGTEVHSLTEAIARGEDIGRVHPDFEPYVNHFRSFLDEFSPEYLHIEETVWSDTYHYAGSFDAIARIGDDVVIVDTKTTKSGVHAEVALQLAAYANADYILRPDGTRVDLPEITGGAVLHLRPEGWQLVPVAITDEVFDVFVRLLDVFRWEKEIKGNVLGAPIGAGS